MHIFKKLIILSAIGALLHLQLPLTGSADAKPAKVTENKPQLAGTAEEFLPGAGSSGGKPFNKRHMWIAAGAVAVLALAIGAAGGGGGGGGGGDNPPDDQEPGGVEVEW
jgi:hypothetical protein